MITDAERIKIARGALFNSILVGFGKGMYELFGDAALATVDEIGAGIVQDMEHDMGVKIEGEDLQAVLAEVSRVLVEEYGMCQQAAFSVSDHQMQVHVEKCIALGACKKLTDSGAPPYTCIPMMVTKPILSKGLGQKIQSADYSVDPDQMICSLGYRMI